MGHFLRARVAVLGLALLGIFIPSQSSAADRCAQAAAVLVSLQGTAEQRRFGATDWSPAAPEEPLCPGDQLRTGSNSRAAILLPNETLIRLDQRTTVIFPEAAAQKGNLLLEIARGIGYFFSRTPKRLEFKTPYVNAAVEGTEFLVDVVPESYSRVGVLDGNVRATNSEGELLLVSGEEAIARPGQAPVKRLIARPRDAVAWALHYPPVTDLATADARGAVRDAIGSFRRGDVAAALAALDRAPHGQRNAQFYNLRASMLLFVGRIEAAQGDLHAAEEREPGNADTLALRSIVALVLNRPTEADRLASKGVALSPGAPAPRIALSYVRQAGFDLEQARDNALAATQADPRNALAWARLAELELALREFDAAVEAAEMAVSLNANLARTQTTLGFARLLRFDGGGAEASFRGAIALDPGDPMPRLGLGISMIRRGDLAAGRKELEVAASLDPGSSIIRSYLGKAYFDEKRDGLAADEYRIAKALDPRDPTPWFYDAIRAQTQNRPVEALDSIQRSVELNDNRAVFRSSLALDADLAARSASLARIYSDLGFEDLALAKGWDAVNLQPGDFSAHRFLADAYVGKPGYEVARASEFLQSQLWQPLNVNPIQPQLAQSNLGIIQSAGPTLAGLNEYNPLFVRDGFQLQANLLAGDDGILANDLAISAVHGRFSAAAGQFHYETDGFRPNADQNQNLYNLFLQLSPSPRASVQAEYRRYEVDQGDTVLRFDPEDFSRGSRFERTSDTLRFGGRFEFSPRSRMIASVMAEEFDLLKRRAEGGPMGPSFLGITENRSLSAEMQQVFTGSRLSLVGGLGYLRVEEEGTATFSGALIPEDAIPGSALPDTASPAPPFPAPPFPAPPFPGPPIPGPLIPEPAFPPVSEADPLPPMDDDETSDNYKAYIYANYAVNDSLDVYAGASYRKCEYSESDLSELDPKLGLRWNVTSATILRAAAFETTGCVGADPSEPALALPQPASQTLEPTQVAGFNQQFNDTSGVTSDVAGLAVDHRFSSRLFAGGQVSRRNLVVPFTDEVDGRGTTKWREDNAHAYLNLALDENWALSLAYRYEMQDYSADLSINGASRLATHRVPLSLRYFAENGVSAGVTASYIAQDIQLFDTFTGIREDDGDRFWLVDAALVYRLPKRYGFVSLEAKNLFNEKFRFQEPDANVPTLYPDRLVLARLGLSFR